LRLRKNGDLIYGTLKVVVVMPMMVALTKMMKLIGISKKYVSKKMMTRMCTSSVIKEKLRVVNISTKLELDKN
jgi:hypothetical protein